MRAASRSGLDDKRRPTLTLIHFFIGRSATATDEIKDASDDEGSYEDGHDGDDDFR